MKILHLDQGSEAWIEARLGKPTASNFGRIVTNRGRRSNSEPSRRYMGELLVQWVKGIQYPSFEGDQAVEWGKLLEPDARRAYAFARDAEVREVGLCLTDDGVAGASPDGLVNDDGGLELKCPFLEEVHLMYLSSGQVPTKYIAQIQGCMWVTGRQWWDFMSFHPDWPEFIQRVHRDESMMAAFDKHIPEFCMDLELRKAMLRDMGVKAELEDAA